METHVCCQQVTYPWSVLKVGIQICGDTALGRPWRTVLSSCNFLYTFCFTFLWGLRTIVFNFRELFLLWGWWGVFFSHTPLLFRNLVHQLHSLPPGIHKLPFPTVSSQHVNICSHQKTKQSNDDINSKILTFAPYVS